MTRIVIDTGPLVALLNRRDVHHAWIREVLDTVEPPSFGFPNPMPLDSATSAGLFSASRAASCR